MLTRLHVYNLIQFQNLSSPKSTENRALLKISHFPLIIRNNTITTSIKWQWRPHFPQSGLPSSPPPQLRTTTATATFRRRPNPAAGGPRSLAGPQNLTTSTAVSRSKQVRWFPRTIRVGSRRRRTCSAVASRRIRRRSCVRRRLRAPISTT